MQRRHTTAAVIGEVSGRHRVVLLADAALLGLLHGIAEPVLQRPLRPRCALVRAVRRWLGQQLELGDRARPLAQGVADAVRAGIPAADHDDVGAVGADLRHARGLRQRRKRTELARYPAVALVQVVHREVDAAQLAAGHRQIARHARPRRQHDRVKAAAQLLPTDVAADVHTAAQLDPLSRQLLRAALDEPLFDLEVRHAEAHQATDRLVALEQRHAMPGPAQLLGRRHPRRPGADDGHAVAGLAPRRFGHDPALVPGAVDDRVLDLLDRDRVALADLEHTRRFARRRAEAPGELGEVVRGVQLRDRLAPAIAIHEIVPVGYQVAQRAAVVAEGDPAVHAASALLA